jgi:hypothetical protein
MNPHIYSLNIDPSFNSRSIDSLILTTNLHWNQQLLLLRLLLIVVLL